MKILITGGCGFLGSNLASHALRQGHELTIFDNLSRVGAFENLQWLRSQGQFLHVHGDIRNSADVQRMVAKVQPDVLFHLAGQVAMTTSIENPRKDFEINALGSLNVLEAVREHAPLAHVVYSSSNKAYGDLEQYRYTELEQRYVCDDCPNGFDENVPIEFHSPYGCSKGAADQYMLDYARIFGLKTTVLRHSSMYGGRQFATFDQGWIGWFCGRALAAKAGKTEPFTISGNGKQVRDVLHAEDMVRLYYGVPTYGEATCGQAFNIGGGIDNSLSLLELFELLEQLVGVPLRYARLPPRESDQRVFVADLNKITKATGWVPKVSKHDGIQRMLDWLAST